MAYFPMFYDIREKKCLIAGGGAVALRKARTLLLYGADVRVVAPEVCGELRDLLPEEQIAYRPVEEADAADAFLVVAATGSRETNHGLAVFCRQRGIPVNVIDAPEECTFLFPAVVKRGDISIGISTGGNSPLVSRRVREQVEEAIPPYYAEVADWLGGLRGKIKASVSDGQTRRRLFRELAGEALEKERILTGEEIEEIIRRISK